MPGKRERLQHQANDRLDAGGRSRTRLPPVPPVKVDLPPVKLGTEFFNPDNGLGELSTVAPSAPTFFEHGWRTCVRKGRGNCSEDGQSLSPDHQGLTGSHNCCARRFRGLPLADAPRITGAWGILQRCPHFAKLCPRKCPLICVERGKLLRTLPNDRNMVFIGEKKKAGRYWNVTAL